MDHKTLLLILLIPALPVLLSACASPAVGVSADAWAYKGYPGPRKDYKELSNVIVRNRSTSNYMLPEEYDDKTVYYHHWLDVIAAIDGDDGSRYSSWNGLWGGNTSSLGYLKMWIEPGRKSIDAVIGQDEISESKISFEYTFEPGYEYRFHCKRLFDHAQPLISLEDHSIYTTGFYIAGFTIDCYFSSKPHDDTDYASSPQRDIVYQKTMMNDKIRIETNTAPDSE